MPSNKIKRKLLILNLIRGGVSTRNIASRLNLHISGVYTHIKRLKEKELITQHEPYNITEKGRSYIENQKILSKNIEIQSQPNIHRLHKFDVKVKIIKGPLDWNTRRQKIARLRRAEPWTANESLFTDFYIEDVKVRTTNKSVIFSIETYAKDAEEAKKKAIDRLYWAIYKVESLLGIILDRPESWNIEVVDQHNSIVNNEIAKYFNEQGKPLKIKDDEDKRDRVKTDKSKGHHELEFVHPIKGEDDSQIMMDEIKDIINEDHYLPSKTKVLIDCLFILHKDIAESVSNIARLHYLQLKANFPSSPTSIKGDRPKEGPSYVG